MDSSDGKTYQMKEINEDYTTMNNPPITNYTPDGNNEIDKNNDNEKNYEKPYYDQTKPTETKSKTYISSSNNSSSYYSYSRPFSCADCLKSIPSFLDRIIELDWFNYLEEEQKLFLIVFIHLIIQTFLIFIFSLIGFLQGTNEAFVDHPWANLVPTTIVILIMTYSVLCMPRDSKLLYIYIALYIPCMIFYLFALSGPTDYINVVCAVVLYMMDLLAFIIAIRKFPYELPFYILFGILSGIFTIITLIIFHFTAVKDGLTTFKISTVGLSEIIYLYIISFAIVKFNVDDTLFVVIVFNLGIFAPLAVVILIILIIIFAYGYFTDNSRHKYKY